MTLRDEHHATRERSQDEQCPTNGQEAQERSHVGRAVDVIDRAAYAELEVDVELIRGALGLMHIELLDSDRASWRALRPAKTRRRAPSWQQPRDGRVGRPPRVAPAASCRGERDSPAVVRCMVSAPSTTWLRRVLYVSCNYEAAAAIPGAIGLSGSTVSRAFIQASATKLRELQERDLSGEDVVALVLDGKTFAEATMVVQMTGDVSGSWASSRRTRRTRRC